MNTPGLPLGFHKPLKPVYLFCNRVNASNWYILENESPKAIEEKWLSGYLKRLEYTKVIRRKKETYLMVLTLVGDRPYVLEAKTDSHFCKCVVSALTVLDPKDLHKVFTVEVVHGSETKAMFANCYIDGDRLKAPYDDKTDWKTAFRIAYDTVNKGKVNSGSTN